VSGFLRNAKNMLSFGGEIHISHKTTHPFTEWKIKDLAKDEGLEFIEEVEFQGSFYPGYNNKRGSGSKCYHSFPIGKSSTFKFSKEDFLDEVIDCSQWRF
jgi:25S rRNA (uracil2634-N3)-methyltransferase